MAPHKLLCELREKNVWSKNKNYVKMACIAIIVITACDT